MKAKIITILLFSVAMVNCSKKDNSTPAAAADPAAPYVDVGTGPYMPPTVGPGMGPGSTFLYGGTTDFIFDGTGVYEDYTQRQIGSLAQLANVKINLNLQRFANNTYGGTVTIRYSDMGQGGQQFEGFFTSGHDSTTNKYNVWFTNAGGLRWHGFFEDFMGGIVVVIDNASSLGDGVSSTDKLSGSVWFKNFDVDPWDVHPSTYCWFVKSGPYDCRAWKSNHAVDTLAGIYPDSGYIRLGTFTNMPAQQAFENLGL